ncbi:Txe/YoeB family addiction module toxin [Mucilaginibacter sp. cycad4]|uniref:Txe/YoeB family addiction module toxin n=1 Tax=Mucilaginibacter sp. cycad4 TaxID=3342096 RepID=UPI002AAB0118|nr:Txe/YoeB family addiction module toxin [Mucilaginibacter gossypii]WPV00020.1 Txe/YoeB family addiction module toxin [Mucilaginibacter gossypii]
MELVITDTAKEDIRFFLKSGQTSIVKKIEKLLVSIQSSPFIGIGKPEPLKYEFSGKWSRRIDNQHRIIYEVIENNIIIYSVKGHYN